MRYFSISQVKPVLAVGGTAPAFMPATSVAPPMVRSPLSPSKKTASALNVLAGMQSSMALSPAKGGMAVDDEAPVARSVAPAHPAAALHPAAMTGAASVAAPAVAAPAVAASVEEAERWVSGAACQGRSYGADDG